jgi:hypothetical protein
MPDSPLVDCHVHVFERGMPFADTAWNRPAYAFTAEQLLELMDANGVQFAVIAAASLFGDYNDYTIRSLRRFKRLRGTVIVGPDGSMYDLEKMNAEGVCGIRLQLFHAELPDLDSFAYRSLFARLRDLDWHVHLLTSRPRLVEAVRRLSATGVKLVIDHFGLAPEGCLHSQEFAAVLQAVAGETPGSSYPPVFAKRSRTRCSPTMPRPSTRPAPTACSSRPTHRSSAGRRMSPIPRRSTTSRSGFRTLIVAPGSVEQPTSFTSTGMHNRAGRVLPRRAQRHPLHQPRARNRIVWQRGGRSTRCHGQPVTSGRECPP